MITINNEKEKLYFNTRMLNYNWLLERDCAIAYILWFSSN